MTENVKKELDQLGDIIDAKLEKAHGQAVESATGKADEALKGEISNLTSKFNERMDAMEVANKKHFEQKIGSVEAEAEAHSELAGELGDIEKEMRQLEQKNNIEDELSALKARIGAKETDKPSNNEIAGLA